MHTNVKNQTGIAKHNDRFLTAAAALRKSVAKPRVDMIEAFLYPTYVEIFCLVDVKQTRGKIPLESLEKFICQDFDMPAVRPGSDMNLSIYIEENLKPICAAYLAAGKDLLPL